MTFKTITAPAIALALSVTNPLQAKAEVTPAQQVVASMSMSLCMMEYGRTQEQATWLFTAGVSEYSHQQVRNITNQPGFKSRVTKHTEASGGCGALVKMMEDAASKELRIRL